VHNKEHFDVVDCILVLMLYPFPWNFTGTDKVEATMSAFIRSHLPEAVLVENLSAELIYQLPDDTASVGKFEQLFVDLDNNLTELGISGYGISNTSLEEVRLLCSVVNHVFSLKYLQIYFTGDIAIH